jgi:predicted nucleic acid-binding protein
VILVDTSVWIEFQRASGSASHLRFRDLLIEGAPIAFTDPVAMEFVSGAKNAAAAERLERMLNYFEMLPFDAPVDFSTATQIYRRCRAHGITPRGFIDCMIAAVALRNGAAILTQNTDLEKIATVMGIELA